MTPIEKAAIALSMADPDERGLPDGVEMAEFYRGLVRAVLQAIREPSEAMMKAAEFGQLTHSYGGDTHSFDYLSAEDAGVAWCAMIDAALSE